MGAISNHVCGKDSIHSYSPQHRREQLDPLLYRLNPIDILSEKEELGRSGFEPLKAEPADLQSARVSL